MMVILGSMRLQVSMKMQKLLTHPVDKTYK
jgi:hypothetical protein